MEDLDDEAVRFTFGKTNNTNSIHSNNNIPYSKDYLNVSIDSNYLFQKSTPSNLPKKPVSSAGWMSIPASSSIFSENSAGSLAQKHTLNKFSEIYKKANKLMSIEFSHNSTDVPLQYKDLDEEFFYDKNQKNHTPTIKRTKCINLRGSGICTPNGKYFGIKNRFNSMADTPARGETPNVNLYEYKITQKNIRGLSYLHDKDKMRKSMANFSSSTPGPGDYNIQQPIQIKSAHTFSKGRRPMSFSNSEATGSYRITDTNFLVNKKNYRKGFSFSKKKRELNLSVDNHSEIGPGFYTYKMNSLAGKDKSPSFTISVPKNYIDHQKKEPMKSHMLHNQSPNTSPNNYQKFSILDRFKNQPSRDLFRNYRPIIKIRKGRKQTDRPDLSPNSKYKKWESFLNKDLSFDFQKEKRKISHLENSPHFQPSGINKISIAETKIQCAKKTRKRIFEENYKKKIEQLQIKLSRNRVKMGKENELTSIIKAWMNLCGLTYLIKNFGHKFTNRKDVRKRSEKLCKILCNFSFSIGKIRSKLLKIKERKATLVLIKFLSHHVRFWLKRRRIKYKNILISFLKQYSENYGLAHAITCVVRQIRIIQKWYRRIYLKRILLLNMMNLQWSLIEYEIIRDRSSKAQEEDEEKKYTLKEKIELNLKGGKLSQVVPTKVRLYFLKTFLEKKNIDFRRESAEYDKKCDELRLKFKNDLDAENAERLLLGLSRISKEITLPMPPFFHVFITRIEMIELIKEALVNRLDWPDYEKKYMMLKISCQRAKIIIHKS